MKKHIQTLQDFAAELATSFDLLSESKTQQVDVLDSIQYAIERLSNQERITAQCDQCTELEDLLGDIKPDADSDASGTRHAGIIEDFFPGSTFITLRMDKPLEEMAAIGDRVTLIL